jgi:predicted amidohydrolase
MIYYFNTKFCWLELEKGGEALIKAYAMESQAFVLHSSTVISEKGIEIFRLANTGPLTENPGGGSSAIFGPDGTRLTQPLEDTVEGIIYADLDFDFILRARHFSDPCGHYSRPDLLWLGVDKSNRSHVVSQGQ